MGGIALVAGDTGTVLVATVRNGQDRSLVDLTGASVRLKYRIDGGALVVRPMTIATPPSSGVAQYRFGENELTAAGSGRSSFRGEIEVQDGDGHIATQLVPINLIIRAKV
ncbi:MAG: BppU family phage baseplate upper protein [Nitrospira sp.]|nr:BppU family phage baseplate upper protein [Nitrospira sp.]